MVYWGGVAFGSIIWGIVGEIWGVPVALFAASIGLVAGLVLSIRYKLKPQTDVDLTPSMHWPMPRVEIDVKEHEDSPVLVEIEFLIDPARSQEFEALLQEFRPIRLRDGAIYWGLFHDMENPGRYVETFVSESWTEHLRLHERATKDHQILEDRARSFHVGKNPLRVSHLIGENFLKQDQVIKEDKD